MSGPPPPPAWGTPPYMGPPPVAPRRRVWLWVLVAIVVIFLVIPIAFLSFAPTAPSVVVTGINFQSPDNACGLDGATDYGFNASTSQTVSFTYAIYGPNATSGNGTLACQIMGVATSTPGFSVTGANVPLSIPANATQDLSYNVITPGSSYTGVLTIVVT